MATAEEVFEQIQQKIASSLRNLPTIVGEEAVSFAMDAFEQEAWPGDAQEVWKKRKNPNAWGQPDPTPERKLLVKTGKLKRSVRVAKIDEQSVTIDAGGSGIPYARAHLFGFRGKVEQNVKPFTRKVKGKQQQVKGFSRTINQNLPQRRYMGGFSDSQYLYKRARRACIAHLSKSLKK